MAKKIIGWSKPAGFTEDELQLPSKIDGMKVNQIANDALANATIANGVDVVAVEEKINAISDSPWGSDAFIDWQWSNQVASIAVTTPPSKVIYNEGEALDLTDIVVTGTYEDLKTVDVTSQCTFNPANGAILTKDNTKVIITFNGLTCEQALTIKCDPLEGFTYTGTYNENYVYNSDNETCLALLTSGTLMLANSGSVDVFLVGGGCGGGYGSIGWWRNGYTGGTSTAFSLQANGGGGVSGSYTSSWSGSVYGGSGGSGGGRAVGSGIILLRKAK